MNYTETVIERVEGTNKHGAKVINVVVKIQSACYTDFVWRKTVGGYESVVCSYKTEKRMRKAMTDYGFYDINA